MIPAALAGLVAIAQDAPELVTEPRLSLQEAGYAARRWGVEEGEFAETVTVIAQTPAVPCDLCVLCG